ncbi:MAG: hypothetical protein HZB18_08425 [Chloroflexi bacterium]|nr:hypothetical protein [Chloroflexota bacterium]
MVKYYLDERKSTLSTADKLSLIGLAVSVLSLLIGFLSYVFPLPAALEPTAFCPDLLSQATLKEWKQAGEVLQPSIGRYIDEFDQIRGVNGGFGAGDVLPRNVFIITAFGNRGETLVYQSYPVKPVVHYKSYGVFQTTKTFKTTFEGACMELDRSTFFNLYVAIPVFLIFIFVSILALPRSSLLKKFFSSKNQRNST